MRKLRIWIVTVLSATLMFCSTHRVWIASFAAANLFILKANAYVYVTGDPGPATTEQQISNATQPASNPAVSVGGVVVGGILNSVTGGQRTKGLNFKDPHISTGLTYRSTDDTSIGGFAGNEYSGDMAFDADIYDGLIVGALYMHTYRGASNNQATSERLESSGVSVYAAKRFFNILNTGLAYNFVDSEHRLTRGTNVNLDRDSHGATMFAGASDRIGNWSWATTPSFTFVHDDYEQQISIDTGVFSWTTSLTYDVTKKFAIGAAGSYVSFPIQDTFPNSGVRDDDYFTVGPRVRFYPTDQLTISADFESQQEYKDYRAYTFRLGVDYAF